LRRGSWRPTKAYEFIFMFSKTNHYYADELREENYGYDGRSVTVAEGHKYTNFTPASGNSQTLYDNLHERWQTSGRNVRDVWSINQRGTKNAHFATFTPDIPAKCIQIGTSERGVCPDCGAQWARVVDNSGKAGSGGHGSKTADHVKLSPSSSIRTKTWTEHVTLGWMPTCSCYPPPPDENWKEHYDAQTTIPSTVLDPFSGSGTTVFIAERMGRQGIGIEVNEEYHAIAERRMAQNGLGI